MQAIQREIEQDRGQRRVRESDADQGQATATGQQFQDQQSNGQLEPKPTERK